MLKEELYKQAEYFDGWADVDTNSRTWDDVYDVPWPTRSVVSELVDDFIDDWEDEVDRNHAWMDNQTNTFLRLLIIEAMDD